MARTYCGSEVAHSIPSINARRSNRSPRLRDFATARLRDSETPRLRDSETPRLRDFETSRLRVMETRRVSEDEPDSSSLTRRVSMDESSDAETEHSSSERVGSAATGEGTPLQFSEERQKMPEPLRKAHSRSAGTGPDYSAR